MEALRWFFLQRGWSKLPWKNSWFTLSACAAVFSALILLMDFTSGKTAFHVPLPKIPLFEKPGSLVVTSSTPGALVQVDDQAAQPAGVTIPQVRVGSHKITVAAPGYDSVVRTDVQINEAALTSLDVGPLARSTGSLTLTTVPAHEPYTLKSTNAGNATTREGRTPAVLTDLPVDTYAVTLGSGDNAQTIQFQVTAHQTTTESIDLVKAGVAGNTNDQAVAGAVKGQSNASALSDTQKKDYVTLLDSEVDKYINAGAYPQAATTIQSLKNLGQNTQPLEQHLSDMQNGYQERVSGQIKELIAQGQLYTAASKLRSVEDNVPPDMAGRLTDQFKGQLDPYAQQIAAAISTANSAAPATGYAQLQPLAQQHPDDVSLALAMAHLLTLQPPDRAAISRQLDTLNQFPTDNLSTDDAGALKAMETKFKTELATYDRLQAATEAEKKPALGDSVSHVAALKRQIARDQASIQGASGVNTAVDSFTTGLFHTHLHVVDVSAKQDEINDDNARIQQIENQQTSLQQNSSAPQQAFDSFCAQVPW